MLTIEDIKDPACKSGFKFVAAPPNSRLASGRTPSFFAHKGNRQKGDPGWLGPRRLTAEEAAQDYCDYINKQRPVLPAALNNAGHPNLGRTEDKHPKLVEADALRREALADRDEDTSGWVYAIGEVDSEEFIKLGKSRTEPKYRLKDLQIGNPRLLKVYGQKQVEDRHVAERVHHAQFIQWNVLGEWFLFVDEIRESFGVAVKRTDSITL